MILPLLLSSSNVSDLKHFHNMQAMAGKISTAYSLRMHAGMSSELLALLCLKLEVAEHRMDQFLYLALMI